MKILVIGTNSASDFISQKLLEDDRVEKIWHVGANASKFTSTRYAPFRMNKDHLLEFIKTTDQKIDLIIPTVLIFQLWKEFDKIVREKNIPILMPSYSLGDIEWSKATGKKLLNFLKIPTPNSKVLTKTELVKDFYNLPRPYVIKYEQDWKQGLQTVIVNDSTIHQEFNTLKSFEKDNEPSFVVEDYIDGVREYSYHAICNRKNWRYLGSARDYKKRYEDDIGYNTISMGAYSPVPDVDPRVDRYVEKILDFLRARSTPFVGILYLGIMVDRNGVPQVLEINTRPGSPEIETIIPTIDNNLLDLFLATASNENIPEIKFNDKSAVSIRIVNKDYKEETDSSKTPFEMPTLWPIIGNIIISTGARSKIFHSVITVSDSTIETASAKLYKFLDNKSMGDFTFRTDIGKFK
jgi:phosphoribosylamine--glycine ligase